MSDQRGPRFTRSGLTQPPSSITPSGLRANTGPIASAAWLLDRELFPIERHWFVEIALGITDEPPPFDGRDDTRFHIELFAEEWGYLFCHAGRTSWIRVTDVPFVHGRDEYQLLHRTPPLPGIGKLLRHVEALHGLRFVRARAAIRTNIADGEHAIRSWIVTL